jgi:tape measure domain-containing protein
LASNIIEIIYTLIDKVSPGAKKVASGLRDVDDGAKKAGSGLDDADKKQSRLSRSMGEFVAVSAGVVYGFKQIGAAAIGAAINYEQQEVAFTTLLGSGLRAKEMLSEIQRVAAETPFEQKDLIDYSSKMLAVGMSAKEVIPSLLMLGDVASGLGIEKLPQIVRAYNDIQAAGRAMGGDLLQLRNASIPIEQYLARVLGVSANSIKDLAADSKISAEDVKAAFQLMTSEGEPFFKMMQTQSKTTGGILSNLRDQIGLLGIAMGTPLLGTINALAGGMQWLIKQFNKMPSEMKTFISIFGAVTAVAFSVAAAVGVATLAFGGLSIALAVLGASSEIGLVVAGFVALYYGIKNNLTDIEIYFKKFLLGVVDFQLGIINAVNFILNSLEKLPGSLKLDLKIDTKYFEGVSDSYKKELAELQKEKDASIKSLAQKDKDALAQKIAAEKAEQERIKALKEAGGAGGGGSDLSKEEEKRREQNLKNAIEAKDEELRIRRAGIEAELLVTYNAGEQETAFAQIQADKYREINARLAEDTKIAAQEEFRLKEEEDALSIEKKILKAEKELSIDTLSSESRANIGAKLHDLELKRLKDIADKNTLQKSMMIDAFAKYGEGQLNIQDAINHGLLDFYKQLAFKELDVMAGKLTLSGTARLAASFGLDPLGYAELASAATLIAGSRAALGAIRLAEGGIVMPSPGGTPAIIGEAGKAEAVIPLDDSRATGLLGDSGGTRVIILDSDGMTSLAKGIYKRQTQLLKTGELSPRK